MTGSEMGGPGADAMHVSVATAAPDPGELAEATAVYAAAFGQAPYHEDEQQSAACTCAAAGCCSPRSSGLPPTSPGTG
jgi:hypothetical protein